MTLSARLLLSTLAGVLGFLGYVGFDQFYLEWIFLVPLLWSIRDVKPRTAFFLGTAAGTVGHLGGFYWIFTTLMEFGRLPASLALLGLILLAVVHGMSFGLWAYVVRLHHIRSGWALGWLAPVVWVAMEHVYPFIFPVFIGASQHPLQHAMQVADITGPLGLSFMVVLANGAAYEALLKRSGRPVAIVALLVTGIVIYGGLRTRTIEAQIRAAPKLTVGLVQANLSARERNASPEVFLQVHREMTLGLERERDFDLVVWPEYVTTLELSGDEIHLPASVQGGSKAPVLFGCISYQNMAGVKRYYGSAILAGPEGEILGRYDKLKLVPFGEYVPFSDYLPALNDLFPHVGNFAIGESLDPILLGRWRLSTSICYEALHAGLIRRMVAVDATPHLLVNLTNDSWYGDTHEPQQHLVLASLRAIENRRALVRVTNTGISAIVDPFGGFEIRSEPWTRATLMGEVPMLECRTLYSRFGDWLGWLCLGLVLFRSIIGGWLDRKE
jgi:apolipoprotein N-acyltransferase